MLVIRDREAGSIIDEVGTWEEYEIRLLRERLFDAMRNDLCVMAEHGDSEASLLEELNACDAEILAEYAEIFL